MPTAPITSFALASILHATIDGYDGTKSNIHCHLLAPSIEIVDDNCYSFLIFFYNNLNVVVHYAPLSWLAKGIGWYS